MFSGFSSETFQFLLDIRNNNNKEFFEANKQTYLDFVYEPMKALGEEISAPFSDSGMIHKTGRIYRDAGFPPFLHYRDNMYFYMLYPAMFWSKSPVLFFPRRALTSDSAYLSQMRQLWSVSGQTLHSLRRIS